jgi:hypothetical protein
MFVIKRIQLGEIHDQPWCPGVIRDGVTDFLQYATNHWGQYTPLLPTLCYFLQKADARQIIDLCSGGCGPWEQFSGTISRVFGKNFHIILTDRYPNLAAFRLASGLSEGTIGFKEEPLDACAIPGELAGFRTLFGSFHHFPPARAQRILQDAVDSEQEIGIFEMTDRRPLTILAMLTTPFFTLAYTPKIRPFRWTRLLLTYLFPVIPLIIMVDGILSCLRSYTLEELAAMTSSLTGTPYQWEIGQRKSPHSPFPVIYAIGYPKACPANKAEQ